MARIYILGAGTPTPTEHRFGSSYVVEVGGEHLMFDCGPAANHQQVFVNRGGTLPRQPPSLRVRDVGPGLVHETVRWRVTAAPAKHVQPYLDSLAYRLDGPDGSIVFTGDTQPCQSVIDLAREADVMLCMCWDDQEVMDENGEGGGQCGPTGAARMAQAAGVTRLVLSHIGAH